MINASISDLQSPDPLVRVRAAPALGDLGAAAIKAIPALLSLTQDETQHPLIRVLAAAAIAKIDPSQTGAVLPVLINALKSDDAPLRVLLRTNRGRWGSMPNPHCLPFSGCSGIIVPLCGLPPLKRSAESPEIECLLCQQRPMRVPLLRLKRARSATSGSRRKRTSSHIRFGLAKEGGN